MTDFAIIPAIDLKDRLVIHASGGARSDYQPIETPLGPADDPITLARALLSVTGSPALYVADLDAIEGSGNHFELCRDLANALRMRCCGSTPASPTSPTAPFGCRLARRSSSAPKA